MVKSNKNNFMLENTKLQKYLHFLVSDNLEKQ